VTRPDIERGVEAALGEVVPGAREKPLDPALLLRDQIELDSVDFLNFVLAVETRFSIEVPPRSYPSFATLSDAAVAVAELLDTKS
jgi:acyl carrier protein